ncbi:MAG: hypothetical protein LBF01_01185 [Bacteroidales bacterium]|jgi:hypothetical protein|nr:hypothetical protein [Bacteroidales bacterium]
MSIFISLRKRRKRGKRRKWSLKQSVSAVILLLTATLQAQSYNTTFRHGDDSWAAGYTGVPPRADDDDIIKIEWKEIDSNKGDYAISFEGKNKNKKTFLYIYRQFTGLKPNSTYSIIFNTQFFSSSQNGTVYVKAGALSYPPATFDLLLTEANFQKGKIGYDGKDLELLGIIYPSNAASTLSGPQQMQNYAKPLYANTDKNGSLWLILGIEPETTTKEIKPILLNTMRVLFQYQRAYSPAFSDNGFEMENVDSEFDDNISSIEIYTGSGHLLKAIYSTDGIFTGNVTVDEFENGRYFFLFNLNNGKKIIRSVER